MGLSIALYRRSPPWLQNVFLNAYALRLHLRRHRPPFPELRKNWSESQWWDESRLREWQDHRLKDIVSYAYHNVPFYNERWSELGIVPEAVQGAGDLSKLPLLTKKEVREAGSRLIAKDPDLGRLSHGHTSGTTGTPLSLYYDRTMCVVNAVADWRQKEWGEMTRKDWCGVLLGRIIVPADQNEAPFWRVNRVHRQVWYSAFHMSRGNLPWYINDIRDRKLRFMEAYPSTLFILGKHLIQAGQRLPMQAVFTSSETLHHTQRETIEEAFQCSVYDFYGQAERVIFAGQCEFHEGKHLFAEYGVTEIVNDEGEPVPTGETGWLTGTTLWNRGMPLIRYRTTDLSSRLNANCQCGRSLGRIADVTTKAEDIVVTPEGRYISPSVLTHAFKPIDSILKSQIIQDDITAITVKLVAGAQFTAEDQRQLVTALGKRVGEEMTIRVERVEDIPPEPSGKFRWVISRVNHMASVAWDSE